VIQFEPPVRRDALGLLFRALRIGQRQSGAVVDRRKPSSKLDLALQLQFALRFVGRINAPRLTQRRECGVVGLAPFRLTFLSIGRDAEPVQICADRLDILFPRSLDIGVVDPQYEFAAAFAREHPVVKRGADIPHMEASGGRWGKTGHGHG